MRQSIYNRDFIKSHFFHNEGYIDSVMRFKQSTAHAALCVFICPKLLIILLDDHDVCNAAHIHHEQEKVRTNTQLAKHYDILSIGKKGVHTLREIHRALG